MSLSLLALKREKRSDFCLLLCPRSWADLINLGREYRAKQKRRTTCWYLHLSTKVQSRRTLNAKIQWSLLPVIRCRLTLRHHTWERWNQNLDLSFTPITWIEMSSWRAMINCVEALRPCGSHAATETLDPQTARDLLTFYRRLSHTMFRNHPDDLWNTVKIRGVILQYEVRLRKSLTESLFRGSIRVSHWLVQYFQSSRIETPSSFFRPWPREWLLKSLPKVP